MWSHLPITEITWLGGGRIVTAVSRAINEDSGDIWFMGIRGGTAHAFHVDYRQCIDGFDAMICRRLARRECSIRAGITMIERADGTFKPTLILDPIWLNDRRKGERKGVEFRRPVQRVVAEVVE